MSALSWVSCMPEDGVEVFTERSEERRQVFEDAASRLKTTQLSPLVWAFLQVCELEQVKELTRDPMRWMLVKTPSGPSSLDTEAKNVVLLWKQSLKASIRAQSNKRSHSGAFSNQSPSSPLRPQAATSPAVTRTRPGKSHGGPEPSVRRDRKIADRCKERDYGFCVISRMSAVDACHIYPWCAFGEKNSDRVNAFWEALGMFWAKEKVRAWKEKIFRNDGEDSPQGIETVENMLTLTATLRRFHSEGAFALRPVRMSDDKKQLELEFHWLARQKRGPSVLVDLLEEPQSSRYREGSGKGYQFCRFADSDPILLVSGTRFTMTTDDAVNKPLPDPGLLELQWHLQRILAISGAAGWKEEEFDDDFAGTGVVAEPAVAQWVDDLPAEFYQSRSPSRSESVESVSGACE